MTTFNAKAETAQHDWYVVDAAGKVVVDLLPCTGLYLEAMAAEVPKATRWPARAGSGASR